MGSVSWYDHVEWILLFCATCSTNLLKTLNFQDNKLCSSSYFGRISGKQLFCWFVWLLWACCEIHSENEKYIHTCIAIGHLAEGQVSVSDQSTSKQLEGARGRVWRGECFSICSVFISRAGSKEPTLGGPKQLGWRACLCGHSVSWWHPLSGSRSILRFAIFTPQKRDSQKKRVQFRNTETIRENQAIRANLRIDSRESGNLSVTVHRDHFADWEAGQPLTSDDLFKRLSKLGKEIALEHLVCQNPP